MVFFPFRISNHAVFSGHPLVKLRLNTETLSWYPGSGLKVFVDVWCSGVGGGWVTDQLHCHSNFSCDKNNEK